MVGMHGGLPPPDAFPFATLGGDLAADPTQQQQQTAMDATGPQLQHLEIADPQLVALAQQYIMTPKVWLNTAVWLQTNGCLLGTPCSGRTFIAARETQQQLRTAAWPQCKKPSA